MERRTRPPKPPLFKSSDDVQSINNEFINSINLEKVIDDLDAEISRFHDESRKAAKRIKLMLSVILFVIVFADSIINITSTLTRVPFIHTTMKHVKKIEDSQHRLTDSTVTVESTFNLK